MRISLMKLMKKKTSEICHKPSPYLKLPSHHFHFHKQFWVTFLNDQNPQSDWHLFSIQPDVSLDLSFPIGLDLDPQIGWETPEVLTGQDNLCQISDVLKLEKCSRLQILICDDESGGFYSVVFSLIWHRWCPRIWSGLSCFSHGLFPADFWLHWY